MAEIQLNERMPQYASSMKEAMMIRSAEMSSTLAQVLDRKTANGHGNGTLLDNHYLKHTQVPTSVEASGHFKIQKYGKKLNLTIHSNSNKKPLQIVNYYHYFGSVFLNFSEIVGESCGGHFVFNYYTNLIYF